MNNKVISGLLFFLSLSIALAYLNEGLFHYDAVSLAQAVEKTFETQRLQPAINGRYGSVILTSIVYVPFWFAGQNADFATRLTSALFYAVSIVFFYTFLVQYLQSRKSAVYASLLFLSAPVYLSPNTYGKEHGMALTFFFLALTLLFVARKKPLVYMVSAGALVVSLTMRESVLVLFPLYFYLLWRQETSLRVRFVYCVLPFLFFFSGLVLAYFSFIITKTLFPTQVGTAYFHFSFKLMKRAVLVVWKTMPVVTISMMMLGVFVGMQMKKYFEQTRFFMVWVIYTFLVYANNSTFTPRYLDSTVAAACVLAGIGIEVVGRYKKHVGIMLAIVLSVWALSIIHPVLAYRQHYNGPLHLGLFIGNLTSQGDIIIAQDDAAFIKYYGNRTSVGLPLGDKNASELLIAEIQKKMSEGISVYLTQTAFVYDPGEINQKLIPKMFQVEKRFVVETEANHFADVEFYKYKHVVSKLKLRNETNN